MLFRSPLGSALGSGPRPLRRRAFLRSSARGRARPARAHAGHQVRGGRRRVSARSGGRSAGLARRGWPWGSSRAGRAAPGRGRGGGGGARTDQGSWLGVQARRPGCAPDRPVGVRGPGRGRRTWWGGVPAIRRAQASSPGPPDAASCSRPRPASGWVGPGLSPGLNPLLVPPSRHLPVTLRWLAAARTHHSVSKAHLPWSPSSVPRSLRICWASIPVPTLGPWEWAALAERRAEMGLGATWARLLSTAPWGRPAC